MVDKSNEPEKDKESKPSEPSEPAKPVEKKVVRVVNEELGTKVDPKLLKKKVMEKQPKSDGKVSVDIYLAAKDIKLHHRGGMVAFAESNKMERATDKEFDALFKKY